MSSVEPQVFFGRKSNRDIESIAGVSSEFLGTGGKFIANMKQTGVNSRLINSGGVRVAFSIDGVASFAMASGEVAIGLKSISDGSLQSVIMVAPAGLSELRNVTQEFNDGRVFSMQPSGLVESIGNFIYNILAPVKGGRRAEDVGTEFLPPNDVVSIDNRRYSDIIRKPVGYSDSGRETARRTHNVITLSIRVANKFQLSADGLRLPSIFRKEAEFWSPANLISKGFNPLDMRVTSDGLKYFRGQLNDDEAEKLIVARGLVTLEDAVIAAIGQGVISEDAGLNALDLFISNYQNGAALNAAGADVALVQVEVGN